MNYSTYIRSHNFVVFGSSVLIGKSVSYSNNSKVIYTTEAV